MLSNIAMSWDIDVGLGFENWGIFMGNFRNHRALEHGLEGLGVCEVCSNRFGSLHVFPLGIPSGKLT